MSLAPLVIQSLSAKLAKYAKKPINYLSVIRYVDGTDYMIWHQHKEDQNPPGKDMSVYIVSTGAVRTLEVRPGALDHERKFVATKGGAVQEIRAEQGSLIVLPSDYNNTHGHQIPKVEEPIGVRYAINCKHMAVVSKATGTKPAMC